MMGVNSRAWTIAAVAAGLLVVGCSTTNPYTHESQTAKATTGAVAGAAGGAVIGLIASGGEAEGALIGAGAGAVAGGAVGYYMDQQEAALRARLEGSGVSVSRVGDSIILNMPGNITFQTDSAVLRPEFFEVLTSVVLVIEEYDRTSIEVMGHTDSTGSTSHNQSLSERRAGTVANYLEGREVSPLRVKVIGYGEAHPLASNETEDGRQRNRRVELALVPIVE